MVAGQSGKVRKSTLRETAARVLVLGHQKAGKSASIVRYTTGRFIQNYCSSTNDWLYRHPIGYDSTRNQYKLVELLEQKDIEFSNSVSRDEEEQHEEQAQERRPAANCSLSSRVALDRRIDYEFYEKQQLLNKLHWANAYVILYALTDSRSFNKAIKYLNLIANQVNKSPVAPRRPILLVGNKRDLVSCSQRGGNASTRCVSHSDGRLLAMRHHCFFAELSISEAAAPIEQAMSKLVESIRATDLHTTRINNLSADLNEQILTQTQLTYWIPATTASYIACQTMYDAHQAGQHNGQQAQNGQPAWSALVKTRLPQAYSSVSQNIVQSSCLAIKAKRLNEADFRLLTPVGMSLSSGSTSSSSSSPGASSLSQAQVAQPLLASATPAALLQADIVQRAASESVGVAQRMAATRPSVSSTSSSVSSSAGATTASNSSKLSSFRSSFRKGALAIVGSRSLAARVACAAQGNKENNGADKRLIRTSRPETRTKTPRSSLSSIQNQDTLSTMSHTTTASDSDTSSAGTIGASEPFKMSSMVKKSPAGQRIDWIKSKISSLSRQETAGSTISGSHSDTASIGQQSLNEQQQQQVLARFRRPLFKYRSRRKTVAFEPTFETNESPSSSSRHAPERPPAACLVRVSACAAEGLSASQADLTPRPAGPTLADFRNSSFNALHTNIASARSSSSLSTGAGLATNTANLSAVAANGALSSVFIIDAVGSPTAPNFAMRRTTSTEQTTSKTTAPTNDSHPTLSRASTSGGSYDEDSELEQEHRQSAALQKGTTTTTNTTTTPAATSPSPARPAKARYQLVKTVQSTLTNLASKASGGGQSPPLAAASPVKRSFCNALFGRHNATLPALATTDRLQLVDVGVAGASQMAQVERIQTMPLMGFCK